MAVRVRPAPRWVAGFDIGGTFTDFVVYDTQSKELTAGKVLSSPEDAVEALVAGVDQLGLDLARVRFIVHGTTVGLNAILEGNGATVGLVTSAGFRDVLEIGLMDKKEMYNLFYRKPRPLVAREHRLGIRERMTYEGEVIMEVEVLEISHNLLEQLGINYPNSFSLSTTKPPNSANPNVPGLVLSDIGKQNKNTIAVSSLAMAGV